MFCSSASFVAFTITTTFDYRWLRTLAWPLYVIQIGLLVTSPLHDVPASVAATATVVALVWSVPNYFSSLPSWWLLLCAVVCLWGFIRHLETDRLLFVGIAFSVLWGTLFAKMTESEGVREVFGLKNLHVMVPFCRTVKEGEKRPSLPVERIDFAPELLDVFAHSTGR